jgi:hypothetical protein
MPVPGRGRVSVMAYTDFLFDVFVSFDREDDKPLIPGSEEGWITRFVHDFQVALALRLGKEISIFFEQQHRFDVLPFEYVNNAIRNSAVFIPIISPAYVSSEWASNELVAFGANPDSSNRIVSVEVLPLKEGTCLPEITGAKSVHFWVFDKGQVERLSPDTDAKTYYLRLARLAEYVAGKFQACVEMPPDGARGRRVSLRGTLTLPRTCVPGRASGRLVDGIRVG